MKKVRFAEKLTVQVMLDWPQTSQEAWIRTWTLKASNDRHFKKRIRSTALQIE